ncbi:unnamed protein product [Gordionus sp. m RMFG-2023]
MLDKRYLFYLLLVIFNYTSKNFSHQNVTKSYQRCQSLNKLLNSISHKSKISTRQEILIKDLTPTSELKICSTFSTPNATCCSKDIEEVLMNQAIKRFRASLFNQFHPLLQTLTFYRQKITEILTIQIINFKLRITKTLKPDFDDSLIASVLNLLDNLTNVLLNSQNDMISQQSEISILIFPDIYRYVMSQRSLPSTNPYSQQYKDCLIRSLTDNPDILNGNKSAFGSHSTRPLSNFDKSKTEGSINLLLKDPFTWVNHANSINILVRSLSLGIIFLQSFLNPTSKDSIQGNVESNNSIGGFNDLSHNCAWALTKMYYCQSCALDIDEENADGYNEKENKSSSNPYLQFDNYLSNNDISTTPICRGLCGNVARGCLPYLEKMGVVWNDYLRQLKTVLNKNKIKLLSTLKKRSPIESFEDKIRRIITKALQVKPSLSFNITKLCGQPTFESKIFPSINLNFNMTTKLNFSERNLEANYDSLVRELIDDLDDNNKWKASVSIGKSDVIFSNIPDMICSQDTSVSASNKNCWDGDLVGRYSKNIVKFGSKALKNNPEIMESNDEIDRQQSFPNLNLRKFRTEIENIQKLTLSSRSLLLAKTDKISQMSLYNFNTTFNYIISTLSSYNNKPKKVLINIDHHHPISQLVDNGQNLYNSYGEGMNVDLEGVEGSGKREKDDNTIMGQQLLESKIKINTKPAKKTTKVVDDEDNNVIGSGYKYKEDGSGDIGMISHLTFSNDSFRKTLMEQTRRNEEKRIDKEGPEGSRSYSDHGRFISIFKEYY